MADQPVEIAPYDSRWPALFAEQRDLLTPLLAPWLDGDIEHVGSTAVPGLAAKPVVDMAAPVRSLEGSRAAIPLLAAQGWLHWADDPMPWRHWFLRPRPERRTHHLYLIERDHAELANLLALRDLLRAEPALAEEYAAHKRALAEQFRDDRNAYTNAKSTFIAACLGYPRRADLPLP